MSALPGVFSVRRPNMLGPIPPDAAGARRKWSSRVMNPVLSTQSPSPAPRNPGQERNRARVSSGCDPHTTHAATPPHPTCPKRSPPHPKQPIFTSSHQSGRRFEHQPDDSPPTQRPNMGGFATIGPRHAGDTPPEASYGRNSPRTCGLGRTSNTTTSTEIPSTLDTSAPHLPTVQSTSATTAYFHQFSPKWTTV